MSSVSTVLITGATDGVGRRVAETLASPTRHLLVHGRDEGRGRSVVEAVERAGGTADFLQADLSSLDEVRGLAETVLARCSHLDVLINNAGIADVDAPRRVSRDGYELHLAVNYLAPFLLTRLLHDGLGGETSSRVVNLTSAAQNSIDFDDLMLERRYDGYRAYGQSKLADIMFTFDLADEWRHRKVTSDCLHPADHMDTAPVRAAGIRPANSAQRGADATIRLAIGPDTSNGTGRYFNSERESRASGQAYDAGARAELRAQTMRLVGLRD